MDAKKAKLKNNLISFCVLFITLFVVTPGYSQEKTEKPSGSLSLSTVTHDDDKSGLEIYINGGYFQDLSQELGSEYYYSAGLLYKASHNLDVYGGGFYNEIHMPDVVLEVGQKTMAFYGLELGMSFYPLGKMPIKPFIGANTAITLFPHPFAKNSLKLGFKVPIPKIISFTLYYSVNHTVSNMLDNYTSHLGGASVTVSIL